jgi:hypothetical protein
MSLALAIIVALPAGPGRFVPTLNGEPLSGPTTEPLLDGCRVLRDRGVPLSAMAVLRHPGSDADCLSARIGYAATRSVVEDGVTGPRLVRWKAPQTCVDRPPIAPTVSISRGLPSAAANAVAEAMG